MNDVKKCPRCGKMLHANAQYCMYCMTSFQTKADITPKVRRSGMWIAIIAGIILLCLTLLVGALLLLRTNRNHPPETNTDVNGVTTEASVETLLPEDDVTTEQEGTEQTKPKVCVHNYLPTDCVTPAVCRFCGEAGPVDSRSHNWKPVIQTVHHDAQGHYEPVEKHFKKTVYLCFFCGYNQEGYDSLEELREHMTAHENDADYGWVSARPDLLADTREVWDSKTEQQWVEDKEAYDETVLLEYVCTLCGSHKAP